jgi:hypothetical protein
LLQHGSILVDDDQSTVGSFAAAPLPPVPAPATLRLALGRAPADAEVAAAIFAAAHCLAVDSVADVSPLGEADRRALDGAADARHARYADPAWTWRR